MTKVLYVMGAGRSGSTMLGVVLGNCEGVCYGGELDSWLRHCGKPSYDRPATRAFWRAIHDRLQKHTDLCGDGCLRSLEHSTALLRPTSRRKARLLRPRYREFSRDLYHAIAEVSGANTVVDTSHYPLRAREMRATPGVDVYLIFLIRNPHAVVESFRATEEPGGRKGLLAANAYLWLTHLVSIVVYLSHPRRRRMVVRYEDFVNNAPATVERILEMAEAPSPPPDTSSLSTGRALAGNRLLRSDRVRVDPALGRPPGRRSLVTRLVQSPWTATVSLLSAGMVTR